MVSGGSDVSGLVVHHADVVVPVDSPAIVDGAIAVDGDTIVGLGTIDQLSSEFSSADVRRWRGVMTPGLVNAHAHLQYTSFDAVGREAYPDYTAWSVRFLDEYATQADADWTTVARDGVDQMLAAGITAIGDVVTDFGARDVLYDLGIPGVAYLEIIGVDTDNWTTEIREPLRNAIESAPTTPVTSVGISPHAPYSVDEPVLSASAELARDLGVRLHIHVAESDGEDEFYRNASGSLADRVRLVATRRVGILERGGAGMGAGELMQHLGVLGPDCHFAHGVFLGVDGRRITAEAGTLVALCPRSNQVVGVGHPPVASYLHEDVPFAVGTDSLASVGSLDLMADVAELRRLAIADGYTDPDLDRRLLHAATMGGATALGLADQLGSLAVGKRADFAVFDVGTDASADADTAVVSAGPGRCVATVIGGIVRWQRG